MFRKIMVPVDLFHADRLTRALDAALVMAKAFQAEIVYVGVTSGMPDGVAHNAREYAAKLETFARAQVEGTDVAATTHAETSHDVAVDIDAALLKAIETTGADLVVMASHIPNLTDYIWPSNGGRVASHAKVSVMVVRTPA